jgi:hypothetical protein
MKYRLTRLRKGTTQVDQDGKAGRESTAWNGIATYDHCTVTIVPEIDRVTGDIATGMSDKEARKLEEENFLPKGTLAPDSEYWHSTKFLIPFPPEGITLDDEVAKDKIKLAVLRAMKKVADGREQLKKKSKAEYLLTSPQAIEAEDDDRFSVKEDAYGLLKDATPAKLRQIFSVLMKQKKNGSIVDSSTMTDLAVKNQLRKELESNPKFFVLVAEDEDLGIKAEIIELVANRVISFTNSGYFRGKDQIAYDLESMVAFANDPNQQNMWIQFKQELQAKKKPAKAKN